MACFQPVRASPPSAVCLRRAHADARARAQHSLAHHALDSTALAARAAGVPRLTLAAAREAPHSRPAARACQTHPSFERSSSDILWRPEDRGGRPHGPHVPPALTVVTSPRHATLAVRERPRIHSLLTSQGLAASQLRPVRPPVPHAARLILRSLSDAPRDPGQIQLCLCPLRKSAREG